MIILLYDPINGIALPDGKVAEVVTDILDKHDPDQHFPIMVDIGNHLTVNQFRLAVADGKLRPDDIEIRYEGHKIYVDLEGKLSSWPKGFCDHLMNLSARLAKRDRTNPKK